MNLFAVYTLTGAIQGLLLSWALFHRQKPLKHSNRYLIGFLVVTSISLAGRYLFVIPEKSILEWQLLYFGDTVIFVFGPLVYLWLKALIPSDTKKRNPAKTALHFLPALLYVIALLPLVPLEGWEFFRRTQELAAFYTTFEASAIVLNIIYLSVCVMLLSQFRRETEKTASWHPNTKLINLFLWISLMLVCVWGISYLVYQIAGVDAYHYLGYQLVWLGLSSVVFLAGYYAISKPDLFAEFRGLKLVQPVSGPGNPSPLQNGEQKHTMDESIDTTSVAIIDRVMSEEKAFLDATLSLPSFAERCGLTPHEVSKIINSHHKLNFFGFVNRHRVEECKRQLTPENLKSRTILAIALEAGFNSKTTFNKAFKDVTGTTPGAFVKQQKLTA